MKMSELSDAERAVLREQMLDLLIEHGFCDEKRMVALEHWVEAAVAWGWLKKTIVSVGLLSGAATAFGVLILAIKSAIESLPK